MLGCVPQRLPKGEIMSSLNPISAYNTRNHAMNAAASTPSNKSRVNVNEVIAPTMAQGTKRPCVTENVDSCKAARVSDAARRVGIEQLCVNDSLKWVPNVPTMDGVSRMWYVDTALQHVKDNKLTVLSLEGFTMVDASILEKVAKFDWLETLILSTANITDADLMILAPLKKLTRLELNFCWKLTGSTLDVVKNFPKLKVFSVQGCGMMSGEGLKNLSDHKHLAYVNLYGCKSMMDEPAMYLKNKSLTHLSVANTSMTNVGFAELSKHPSLVYLDMEGCIQIPESYYADMPVFPKLCYLDISWTFLNDEGIKRFKDFGELRLLRISNNGRVSYGAGVDWAKKHLTQVEKLYADPGCQLIWNYGDLLTILTWPMRQDVRNEWGNVNTSLQESIKNEMFRDREKLKENGLIKK